MVDYCFIKAFSKENLEREKNTGNELPLLIRERVILEN
jgi:hypothetical protein